MRDKRKIYVLLGTVIFLALAAEILFALPHHHMIWNEVPGADIVIGFAGAWLLILLAKKIMGGLFQRREDYYEEPGTDGQSAAAELKAGGGAAGGAELHGGSEATGGGTADRGLAGSYMTDGGEKDP